MGLVEAILLGIIEGITEFLPISSTAHLTISEKLLNLKIDDAGIVAFTAIIQIGAILATLVYFRHDIWRIVVGWLSGLFSVGRQSDDYRLGWAIIVGSLPIGIIGLLFKDHIENDLRSLWLVASTMVAWSFVMWLADKRGSQRRHETDIGWRDTLIIGLTQCLALVPGVSRSGATISAGLLRGIDRVAVTRLSFFLAIPALLAAGLLELITKADDIANGVGWTNTLVATAISFVVAYASIAWLLRFVAKHDFKAFIIYRLTLSALLIILLATGVI